MATLETSMIFAMRSWLFYQHRVIVNPKATPTFDSSDSCSVHAMIGLSKDDVGQEKIEMVVVDDNGTDLGTGVEHGGEEKNMLGTRGPFSTAWARAPVIVYSPTRDPFQLQKNVRA